MRVRRPDTRTTKIFFFSVELVEAESLLDSALKFTVPQWDHAESEIRFFGNSTRSTIEVTKSVQEPRNVPQAKIQLLYPVMLKIERFETKF